MNIAEALQKSRNTIGHGYGNIYGTYQCFGYAAHYSNWLGGVGLGHDIGFSHHIKGGLNAGDIATDFAWNEVGWGIIANPTKEDIMNNIGALITYAGFTPIGITQYGHVAVVSGYDDNNIHEFEQNGIAGQFLNEVSYGWGAVLASANYLILPPELVNKNGSGSGSGSTGTNGGGNVQNLVTTKFVASSTLYRVYSNDRYSTKKYGIKNLLYMSVIELSRQLKNITGGDFELQLLNQEFTEIVLYDFYGNSYTYNPLLFDREISQDKKAWYVLATGSLGEHPQTHFTIANYNNKDKYNYTGYEGNIEDNFGVQYGMPNNYNYGFNDMTGRNITIINDAMASWLQTNSNANKATQLSFKENADMLKKSSELSMNKTKLANEQATYSSNFNIQKAVDNRNLGLLENGFGTLGSTLNGFAGGGLLGAGAGLLGGLYKTGKSWYMDDRELTNQRVLGDYTAQNNKLNTQSTTLANLQAKLAQDQAIRAYNASLADIQNQPDSIQQIGNDISWQTGNSLFDVFVRINTAQIEILKRANDYIKQYGVVLNEFREVFKLFNQRQRFGYVKVKDIDLKGIEINQNHSRGLSAIFESGIRVWDIGAIKEDMDKGDNIFDLSKNNPNWRSDEITTIFNIMEEQK